MAQFLVIFGYKFLKRKITKNTFIALFLIAAFAFSGKAQDNKKKTIEEKAQAKVAKMKSELDLTKDQEEKINALFMDHYALMRVQKKKVKELEAEMAKMKKANSAAVKAVLTEGQVAKMKKKKK